MVHPYLARKWSLDITPSGPHLKTSSNTPGSSRIAKYPRSQEQDRLALQYQTNTTSLSSSWTVSPTRSTKIQPQLSNIQSTPLPKQQYQTLKETKMRLLFLLFVLWVATCIGYVLRAANPARLLSATSQGNHRSPSSPSPPPPSPSLQERNAPTKTITAGQARATEPPPETGRRPYSGPQIFAISYASVFGFVMLGCFVWIWSGRFFWNGG